MSASDEGTEGGEAMFPEVQRSVTRMLMRATGWVEWCIFGKMTDLRRLLTASHEPSV
jgi:hypothetical protein